MKRVYKCTAWLVLTFFVTSLGAPLAHAGNSDDDYYASQVEQRVALRGSLEQQYQDAMKRQQEIQAQLDEIDRYQPKSQEEQDQLSRQRSQLREYFERNDTILGRTKERLTEVYNNLQADYTKVSNSTSPRLQQLGDVIGAAGASSFVAPLAARPTVGELGASGGYLFNKARLGTVNVRIGADGTSGLYNRAATGLGNAATNNAAAATQLQGTKWVKVGTPGDAGFRLQPQQANGQFAKGSLRPPEGLSPTQQARWADNMVSLKGSHANITHDLNIAQRQLRATTSAKGKAILEARVKSLQSKQASLQGDINKFEAETAPQHTPKGQLKTMAISAGKWAAMSVGITIGANVVTQLSNNGWDPRAVDWKAATADIRTTQFWGGTAGSFLGSYGASIIASALPGGPFVKALAAVGGAAIGWQVGSGNLANTDWTQLGVTTVGATIGMLIGQAICPIPGLGAILGGIAGNWLANKALGMVRDWLATPTSTSSSQDQTYSYGDGYQNPAQSGGYQGGDPSVSGGYQDAGSGGYSQAQIGSLKTERDQAYKEWMAAQNEYPRDLAKVEQALRSFQEKTRQLRSLQAGSSMSDYDRYGNRR